ncbi:MAG TPA: DUF2089 family protein [Planctomycetaceae bacterium]|nr:DUF2089 family protein [Planctomycetaceae bacterium]
MPNSRDWMDLLDDEDLAFLKRFVLASGSLKDLAAAYGISYPTVRLRLDRLIAKVQIFDAQQPLDEFERTVRALHVDGKIDQSTLKTLLSLHNSQMETDHAANSISASDVVDPRKRRSGSR